MLSKTLREMQLTRDHFRYSHSVLFSQLLSFYQLAREILPNGPVGVAMAKVAINKGSEVMEIPSFMSKLLLRTILRNMTSLINCNPRLT